VDPLNSISGLARGQSSEQQKQELPLRRLRARRYKPPEKQLAEAGLLDRVALAKATEGVLEAAEALGADAVVRVKKALPVEALPEESKRSAQDV